MRTTTINLIVGILIGMFISEISDTVSGPTSNAPRAIPTATTVTLPTHEPLTTGSLETTIAPGLQIIQVPPPLDINGLHPYQCYLNGQPVNIPTEVVKGLLAGHEDTSKQDPNFNVHNFTGNLKFVGGRSRGVVGE